VFDLAAGGAIIFHAATGIDANAIADVQACVRRRLLRVVVRRSLPHSRQDRTSSNEVFPLKRQTQLWKLGQVCGGRG
jgi:hypothetical protein